MIIALVALYLFEEGFKVSHTFPLSRKERKEEKKRREEKIKEKSLSFFS